MGTARGTDDQVKGGEGQSPSREKDDALGWVLQEQTLRRSRVGETTRERGRQTSRSVISDQITDPTQVSAVSYTSECPGRREGSWLSQSVPLSHGSPGTLMLQRVQMKLLQKPGIVLQGSVWGGSPPEQPGRWEEQQPGSGATPPSCLTGIGCFHPQQAWPWTLRLRCHACG